MNPIAVTAARRNFLLAMGELLRYVRSIEIPIYICDAVLTPVKHRSQSSFPEIQEGYEVVTHAGTFVIPREIVNRGVIDRFAAFWGIALNCSSSTRLALRSVRRIDRTRTQRTEAGRSTSARLAETGHHRHVGLALSA